MKKFENKKTDIIVKENDLDKNLTYSDLLKLVVNAPPQNGLSISEMRDRLRIYDSLELAKEEVSLEDSDFLVLKAVFDSFKWAQVHKDIIALSDVLNAL